jgi:hypothetical protein
MILTGLRDFEELLEHEKAVIKRLKIRIKGKATGFIGFKKFNFYLQN